MPSELVKRWHVLHARALDLNSAATHLTDLMAQACFREMAAVEAKLTQQQGDAELGEAKVLILLNNYDIGGRDYSGGLANPTLLLMLSAADDLRPRVTASMQHAM